MKKTLIALVFVALASIVTEAKTSRWTALDGNRIHYLEAGDRKNDSALIFIHGWTCNAEFWNDSFSAFRGHRVIAIDLPGHGKSDKPTIDYTMDHFARSVKAVMDSAGIRRAVLVGHSMGMPIARQFYRRYPDAVAGIVSVDGALRPFMPKEAFEQFFAPIRADYVKNVPVFMDGMLNVIKDENLRVQIRESMLSTPGFVAISAMDGMGDMKIWETDKIGVPVLAWMADGPFSKPDEEEFFRSVAPDLEFHMIKGVSHFLMMEDPAAFNEAVRKFVYGRKLL